MPRLTEIQELLNNCSGSVSTYNGVKGMTVTGQNGNSIFLPFAGVCFDGDLDEGYYGFYWSSSHENYAYGGCAYILYFYDYPIGLEWGTHAPVYGFSVRPVKER